MSAQHQAKIDALMEQASQALVERRYFDTERLCADALRRAHAIRDYERMTRILLPLQEARRQKRTEALDSGEVHVVAGELPAGRSLSAGCYLVCPPRVGVDGRLIRETAEKKKTPVLVIVREPRTQEGLWPLVAVGPVTVRTKVAPPKGMDGPEFEWAPEFKPSRRGKTAAEVESPPAVTTRGAPPREWFIAASEALGDAAIASVSESLPAEYRVDALLERLEAIPDHEKLHQRLGEAALVAAKEPPSSRRAPIDPLDEEAEDVEEEAEDDDL